MGRVPRDIDESTRAFLLAQPVFFVGTAPSDPEGHLNLSPRDPACARVVAVRGGRVADSCGYAVPRTDYAGDRDRLERWAERRGEEGLADHRRRRNAVSIDGLPALGLRPPAGG